MAPQVPDTPGPLRNILLLDQSTAPLAEQVKEAGDILAITLYSSGDGLREAQQQPRRQGPREEWTLRWLLKKLESTSLSQAELLEPTVWILLRELIPRLPVANLARLLRANGFLGIVSKLLNSLEERASEKEELDDYGPPPLSPSTTSSDSLGAADSSSATIDHAPKVSAGSKKRKRDGTSPADQHVEEGVGVNASGVFVIVCDVVTDLQALTQDNSHGAEGAADKSASTVTVLEGLLLEDVVFPARESFENTKRTPASRRDLSGRIDFDDLLSPLAEALYLNMPNHTRLVYPLLVSRLYLFCLQHTSLSTAKQRVFGQAWLQYLFDYLAKRLSAWVMFSRGPVSKSNAPVAVKSILESLLECGVKLNVPSLQKILVKYSHIFVGVVADVDWDLVGLCLRMNFDVFLLSDSENSGDPKDRKPYNFSNALFSKVAAIPAELHEAVLDAVIIPLMDGFAHARNVSKFVDHWRSNLIQSKTQVTEQHPLANNDMAGAELDPPAEHQKSIWEHENLLQTMSNQVERHLTAGQIEAILLEWKNTCTAVDQANNAEQQLLCAANLVIVDAILNGCATEDTMSKVAKTVHEVYSIMVAFPAIEDTSFGYSWRLWRCMATIKNRWGLMLTQELDVRDGEQKALEQALKLQYESMDDPAGDEVVHSLGYILGVTENAEPKPQHYIFDCIVDSVTRRAQTHLHNAQSKPLTSSQTDQNVTWAPHLEDAGRRNVCLCICQLMYRPRALIYVESDIQNRFFQGLFECSMEDFKRRDLIHENDMPEKQMDFYDLWQRLLLSLMLEENAIIAKTLRTFQVDMLLQYGMFDGYLATTRERTAYALAFQSVHQTSWNLFDRRQRGQICNKILDILLYDRSLEPQMVKDHLKFLINSITHPVKAMKILHDVGQGLNDSVAVEDDQERPMLFRVAASLKDNISASSSEIEIFALLKLLATTVLNYHLSNSNEKQSLSFLKSYHEFVHHRVEDMDLAEDPYSAALMAASLSFYHVKVPELPQELQYDQQQPLRPNSIQTLSKIIHGVGGSDLNSTESSSTDHLHPYRIHVLTPSFLRFVLVNLQQSVDLELPRSRGGRRPRPGAPLREGVKQALALTKQLLESHENIESIQSRQRSRHNSIQEQRRLVSTRVQHFRTLDSNKAAQSIITLANPTPDDRLHRDNLLMLQGIFASQAYLSLSTPEDFSKAVSHTINELCDSLLQPQPFQNSVLTLQMLDSILHRQSRAVSQWHIDQLMAAIATSASRSFSVSGYTPKQTGLQYLALCRVFSTVLAFHRKRLGGRFHLILAILKSLLHSLFLPHTTVRLNGPNSQNAVKPAFNATHAAHFSRILLQLADPPLSSLTKKPRSKDQHHHHLNDETKIAKSIAGQHLHYFIMSYCDCHLKGFLGVDVRKKLEPGIWAVLDIIPQEVMRVMNAGMDKAGRAIWKGLYDEWRRGGGGRERTGR
ncbi:MAG: hypothetical protein Q9220_007546 [cf. Caloplaca sp. 1 TL-2023]